MNKCVDCCKDYIGIDGGYAGIYDGIVAIRCTKCQCEFPRCDSPWALEMFEKYQKHCGIKVTKKSKKKAPALHRG